MATSGSAAAAQQIYCAIIDLGDGAYYFSDVFEGDYARTSDLEDAHLAFVRRARPVSEEYQSLCFLEKTAGAAAAERKQRIDEALGQESPVYETHWTGR
jgi:hypothetical protein